MSERIAYFDCFSGASGDMLLGALLHAGLELSVLARDIAQLDLGDVELRVTPHVGHGISGARFQVIDSTGEQPARNLPSVRAILEGSSLPADVVADSLKVFQRLAEAEAKVHGVGLEEVHFHELGAVDTLVDIVGFCSAVRHLELEALYASPLPLGSGVIRTAHGLLPLPAPATLELLAAAEVPTVASPASSELVTPTGAALLSTLASFERPAMRVARVGYGFGMRELPWANMLRVWFGALSEAPASPHAHPTPSAHPHQRDHDHDHGHDHAHHHDHDHDHDSGHAHDSDHAHHTHHPD